jgi:hypothetical protein
MGLKVEHSLLIMISLPAPARLHLSQEVLDGQARRLRLGE